jgi:hypothetical protein
MKTVNNIYMYVIGALIIIGFFMALVYMAMNNADGKYTSVITDMTSTIKYSMILIVGYYWGSSKGSAEKTQLLANPKV